MEAFTSAPERPARPRPASRPRVRRPAPPGQHSLDFSPPAAPVTPARTGGSVEYCDAVVAPCAHRAIAAILDFSMIAIALGGFTGTLYELGIPLEFGKYTAPVAVTVALVFVVLYRLLWCLGNGDSPGLRWAQLRLVDLDGRAPKRSQRFHRLFAGCLSCVAAGLGLLWALADEESLTWHDHISKTFPTAQAR